jgi:hypothetical protein
MALARTPSRWLAVALVAVPPVAVLPVEAQELDPGRVFRVTPLFAAAQVYDSNLFSSAAMATSDVITRVSPGLESEYRAARFSVFGRYALDLDRFAGHPELTAADGRQQAALRVQANRSRRLTLSVDASFARTHTPGELTNATGLTLARSAAERLEVHPAVVGQLGPVMKGRLDYARTDERIMGGIATRTQRAGLQIDREVSRKDVVDVKYGVRTYDFNAGTRTIAHAVGIGWSRQLTRQTHVEVHGGPVLDGRHSAPEVLVSWRYRHRPAELSLTYARTQTTLIGFERTVDTRTVAASAAYKPTSRLQLRAAPAVFRTTSGALRADAGRLTLEAEVGMSSRLSLRAMYDATLQRGNLTPARASTISRHLVQVSVAVTAGRSHRRG